MIISPHPNEMLHSPPPPIHHMSNYYPLYENTPATPNDLDFSLLEHEFTDLCNVDEGYASWERNDQSPIEKALSEGFTCGTTFDWIHNEVRKKKTGSESALEPGGLFLCAKRKLCFWVGVRGWRQGTLVDVQASLFALELWTRGPHVGNS